MINNTFLSICILTFDRAEKLNRLLINIKEQIKNLDSKNKIEILIADNCSTDSTEEIVNNSRIYFNDIKFKYYKHSTNIGVDRNTDFLYRNACGKYVWFMADNVILEDDAISIVFNLLLDYEPSAMLFSFIQEGAFTPEKPTFNISQPVELFTNYEQVIRKIIKWPKISIYIIEKELLNEQDDLILNNYLDTGLYHVTLMLHVFLKSEKHSLLVHRKPLAMAYKDCFNLRYSPRVFSNKKLAASLPYIINNYPYIINDIQTDYDDTVLHFLIQDKLGNLQLDMSVKKKEYKWVYRNFKKLLIKKNTRALTIYLILLNSPFKWIFSVAIFRKLYHIAKNILSYFKKCLRIIKRPRDQREILDFYSHFINKGDLCFDVGANLGNRTEVFLKLGAKIVCIEPQDSCLKILNRLFGNNNNVIIINKGLAEKEGYLELHICENATVISTMSDKWMKEGRFSDDYKWTKTQLIPVTTLDNLIKKYGLPKFCKIDVEGFEYPVLKGLTKQIPYISFEFTREFFDDAKKCINHLLSIDHAEFNCSIGESYQLLFSSWITPKELYNKLESFEEKSLWGDIYVKFL